MISEHPLGFRTLYDRFAGHAAQVIRLDNVSVFGFRIVSGALFVMLGAFTVGLIFRRKSKLNPDCLATIRVEMRRCFRRDRAAPNNS